MMVSCTWSGHFPCCRSSSLGAGRLRLRAVVVGGRANPCETRRVATVDLVGQVRFVGYIPSPERYYVAIDVFALPTHFDPFANATLEAMATRLPVVTTRQNGVAEIIALVTNGIVLSDLPTAAGLVAVLTEYEDGYRRRSVSRAARETALAFPWGATVAGKLELYRFMRETSR
jgi:glycosyltransferase involved in cell wall biosynthesis